MPCLHRCYGAWHYSTLQYSTRFFFPFLTCVQTAEGALESICFSSRKFYGYVQERKGMTFIEDSFAYNILKGCWVEV